jgi:hypothetical protein
MTIVFILLNLFVIHFTSWDIAGLAAMTSIAATFHGIVMLVILNMRVGKIADFPLGMTILKTILATIGLIIVCVPLHGALAVAFPASSGTLNSLSQLIIVGIIGLVAFGGLAYIMNMSEINVVKSLAMRLSGKNKT